MPRGLASLLVGLHDSRGLFKFGRAGQDVEGVDCLHEVLSSTPVGALVVSRPAEVYVNRRVHRPAPVQPRRSADVRALTTAAACGGQSPPLTGHPPLLSERDNSNFGRCVVGVVTGLGEVKGLLIRTSLRAIVALRVASLIRVSVLGGGRT